MTPSTQPHASVIQIPLSAGALGAVCEDLVAEWSAPRRTYLDRRQARTTYAIDAIKKVRHRIALPFDLLLAGSFADIDDGAPLHAVERPYHSAIALIRARAAAKERRSCLPFGVRLRALNAKETKAESKMTAMQFALAPDEHNLDTLLALQAASQEYQHVKDEYDAMLAERIAEAQLERATA